MRKFYHIILMFVLMIGTSKAQISQGWFTFDTTNSPLPSNFVTDVRIESNNELWIATSKGLVRINQLDGQFFWEVFNNTNDLPDLWINKVKIDFFGRKWLATAEGGVVVFDNFNFINYNILNSPLTTNRILDIEFDLNADVWIGTDGGGLYKLSGNQWTIYNSANTGQALDIVHKITIDNLNRKWIGTQLGGLLIFDDLDWLTLNNLNSEIPFNIVRDIYIEGDTNIWLGLGSSRPDSSLVSFNGSQTFKVWNEFNSNGLKHTNIWNIFKDSKGNKWFSSNDSKYGVAVYNDTLFSNFSTNNSGIPSNRTYGVTEDDSANVWIATFRGLAFYNPNNLNVGVDEFWEHNIETYPNPVQNQLFVKSKEFHNNYNVFIADASGRIVFEQYVTQCDWGCSLNLNHLQNGVYILKIKEIETYSTKLIVMK